MKTLQPVYLKVKTIVQNLRCLEVRSGMTSGPFCLIPHLLTLHLKPWEYVISAIDELRNWVFIDFFFFFFSHYPDLSQSFNLFLNCFYKLQCNTDYKNLRKLGLVIVALTDSDPYFSVCLSFSYSQH